jgi:hypothetical protein
MLKRRLQTTCKGSFLITLPIHIVLALGLQRGHDLKITLEKNTIVLTPVPTVTRQDVGGTEDRHYHFARGAGNEY